MGRLFLQTTDCVCCDVEGVRHYIDWHEPTRALNSNLNGQMLAGYTAAQVFGQGICYTYDDIIFQPGHINFGAHEVDLTSNITKNIKLRIPIVSSPMDTVTEAEVRPRSDFSLRQHLSLSRPAPWSCSCPSRPEKAQTASWKGPLACSAGTQPSRRSRAQMAIAMATLGGMGFLHYNATVEDQASWVRRVKSHREGCIYSPVVMGPDATIKDLDNLKVSKVLIQAGLPPAKPLAPLTPACVAPLTNACVVGATRVAPSIGAASGERTLSWRGHTRAEDTLVLRTLSC